MNTSLTQRVHLVRKQAQRSGLRLEKGGQMEFPAKGWYFVRATWKPGDARFRSHVVFYARTTREAECFAAGLTHNEPDPHPDDLPFE